MIRNMQKLFDLSGKAAVITGAGSGLGQGIAEGYAQLGAGVSVVDVNPETAQSVADGIKAGGGEAISVPCDVTQADQVLAAVAQTLKEFGKIDVLVANAGIGDRNPAEEMTDQQWERVMDTNLTGVWLFDQAVGKHMIKRGEGGRIINMASIGGIVGVETGNANYCDSKGGIIALTRCLAIEWAKHNVLVNAIAPSHIRTRLIAKLMEDKPEVRTYFLSNIPLNRLGEVEDVVGPAIFLASDAASFVTGHVLVADGGHTAK
jgi:NAD(P)-dependent dehydrogenase (short-subunit alcohol dehydrogenase family)